MEAYLLFDCCKVISGYTRSMILDIQRKAFYFIPNELASCIDHQGVIRENESSAELLQFLLEEELAFKCEASLLQQFIAAKTTVWDYPARITNAIVCFENFNEQELKNAVEQLTETLQCKYIEFRFNKPMSLKMIDLATAYISQFNLLGFSLGICLEDHLTDQMQLQQILSNHVRLFKTIVFNYPKEDVLHTGGSNYGNIFFTKVSDLQLSCGIVSDALFTTHSSHYYESLAHNTCLNRKLAIDADGNIKNCPSMVKSYGNIKNTRLIEIVNSPEFQKLWNIKKDDINKCKDCEFRHICTDCRAFTEDPEDMYSKPLKCGYDPYTNEWEEWSTLPFKQKAMAFYGITTTVNSKP